jgi:cell wall assembly regulator SMI1
MTIEQQKQFIQDFFEKYYAKQAAICETVLMLPDVPQLMLAEGADSNEEWNKWKLIPSTITEKDIAALENQLGVSLPNILKIFFTTYFHFFDYPVGRHSIDEPFEAIQNAWNPLLIKAGYLPFTWDKDGYFIRCIDLVNIPDENACKICQIDHEILFDFDEESEISREEIADKMEVIADNFLQYLNHIIQ